jgi:hypothetical protein
MEALSQMVDQVVRGGYLTGFTVETSTGHSLLVSHLLFTNDTLIFCNTHYTQIEHLKYVFTWLGAAFGLKINLSKSKMILVGVVPNLEELVRIVWCETTSLLIKYLGLPLGATWL